MLRGFDRRTLGLTLCAAGAVWLACEAQVRADTVVVVTPNNLDGWAANITDSDGNTGGNPTAGVNFVTGPGTPPLGVGSVNIFTGNGTTGGDGSAQIRNVNYAGTLLSSLTSLSYSEYVTSWNGQQTPYLSLAVSTTGSGPPDDVLFFEPAYQTPSTGNPSLPDQGSPTTGTWQTWNALEGGWWDNANIFGPGTGVGSLAAFEAMFPSATIENVGGLGGVRFSVGFADPTDVFNGNVDNFTIGVAGSSTTFDFEPSPAPEPASMTMLACGALGLAWPLRKRRSRQTNY
jgi:hypothetical protein